MFNRAFFEAMRHFMVVSHGAAGAVVGVTTEYRDKPVQLANVWMGFVGGTSLGVISGFLYPLTLPYFAFLAFDRFSSSREQYGGGRLIFPGSPARPQFSLTDSKPWPT